MIAVRRALWVKECSCCMRAESRRRKYPSTRAVPELLGRRATRRTTCGTEARSKHAFEQESWQHCYRFAPFALICGYVTSDAIAGQSQQTPAQAANSRPIDRKLFSALHLSG